MYGSIRLNLPKGNFPRFAGYSRISKIGCYENPYAVTGGKTEKLGTGSEEAPKSINNHVSMVDRIVGTW